MFTYVFIFTPFNSGLQKESLMGGFDFTAISLLTCRFCFEKGKLCLSAPAGCMVCQFGEVYHLPLIAVRPRNGTEQFSVLMSAALEKNLGAIF